MARLCCISLTFSTRCVSFKQAISLQPTGTDIIQSLAEISSTFGDKSVHSQVPSRQYPAQHAVMSSRDDSKAHLARATATASASVVTHSCYIVHILSIRAGGNERSTLTALIFLLRWTPHHTTVDCVAHTTLAHRLGPKTFTHSFYVFYGQLFGHPAPACSCHDTTSSKPAPNRVQTTPGQLQHNSMMQDLLQVVRELLKRCFEQLCVAAPVVACHALKTTVSRLFL
jgi:hypothetical protein